MTRKAAFDLEQRLRDDRADPAEADDDDMAALGGRHRHRLFSSTTFGRARAEVVRSGSSRSPRRSGDHGFDRTARLGLEPWPHRIHQHEDQRD